MGSLISFSGFDGTGKTTQVKLLSGYLRKGGKRVKTTEEMFGYFLLKPIVGVLRKTTGSPMDGPVKRNKSLLLKLWFIPAFMDIWLMFLFKIKPMLSRYDVVIADRFYTDIWANLLYYGYLPKWAFSTFVKLLPKSDIPIMLSVEPEIVQKREREFPPAYYNKQAKIYGSLEDNINFRKVDAVEDKQKVFSMIKEVVNEKN